MRIAGFYSFRLALITIMPISSFKITCYFPEKWSCRRWFSVLSGI